MAVSQNLNGLVRKQSFKVENLLVGLVVKEREVPERSLTTISGRWSSECAERMETPIWNACRLVSLSVHPLWIEGYHIDVLRLDAVHGIFDFGGTRILAELQAEISETAKRLGRNVTLVAESNLNDATVLLSGERGGYGIRAPWRTANEPCTEQP